LWLIPFTLAKKLLSLNLSVAKDNFWLIVCGAKKRPRCARRVSKKIWGEDPLFRNAARGYNKKNYSRLEKFPLRKKTIRR